MDILIYNKITSRKGITNKTIAKAKKNRDNIQESIQQP